MPPNNKGLRILRGNLGQTAMGGDTRVFYWSRETRSVKGETFLLFPLGKKDFCCTHSGDICMWAAEKCISSVARGTKSPFSFLSLDPGEKS